MPIDSKYVTEIEEEVPSVETLRQRLGIGKPPVQDEEFQVSPTSLGTVTFHMDNAKEELSLSTTVAQPIVPPPVNPVQEYLEQTQEQQMAEEQHNEQSDNGGYWGESIQLDTENLTELTTDQIVSSVSEDAKTEEQIIPGIEESPEKIQESEYRDQVISPADTEPSITVAPSIVPDDDDDTEIESVSVVFESVHAEETAVSQETETSIDIPEPEEVDTDLDQVAPVVPPITEESEQEAFEEYQRKIEEESIAVIPSWFDHVVKRVHNNVIPAHFGDEMVDKQAAACVPDPTLDSERFMAMKSKSLDDLSTFPSTLVRGIINYRKGEGGAVHEATEEFHRLVRPARRLDIDGKKYGDSKSDRTTFTQSEPVREVKGKAAVTLVSSLVSGLRRVRLYNSGFSIRLRPPSKSEMYQFVVKCKSTEYEFGRVFGVLSYLPANVELIQAAKELIELCTCDSNLDGWNIPGTISQNIAYPDVQTALWGLLALMYPEGVPVTILCNLPSCGKADEAMVDPAKMRINDYSRISTDAVKYTCENTMRTKEDLQKYHLELMKDRETVSLDNGFHVHVRVPSLEDYIQCGIAYVSELAAVVSTKKAVDCEAMVQNKYYRIFVPYIEKITYVDPNTGNVVVISDPTTIPDVLDKLELDGSNEKFRELMHDYIGRRRVSHFGYVYDKCPHCGTVPDIAINGFIPVDILRTFFTLTTMRLEWLRRVN